MQLRQQTSHVSTIVRKHIGRAYKFAMVRAALAAVVLAVALAGTSSAPAQVAPKGGGTRERQSVWSVVAIQNKTSDSITYQLCWPGGVWTNYTVEPARLRWHWAAGQNVQPEILYDADFADGVQARSHRLQARDFVGARPGKAGDGVVYSFQVNGGRTGLALLAGTILNKSNWPAERLRLDAGTRATFPSLLSNYEVLGPATPRTVLGCYNCIAWSLGLTDRWVWPGDTMADFDRLYESQGFRRLPSLDYQRTASVQKIVLYGHVTANGAVLCTHAARQEANGAWTSKLGELACILHLSPDDLNGQSYGHPIAVYVRESPRPLGKVR